MTNPDLPPAMQSPDGFLHSDVGKIVKTGVMAGSSIAAMNMEKKQGRKPGTVGGIIPNPQTDGSLKQNAIAGAGALSCGYVFYSFLVIPFLVFWFFITSLVAVYTSYGLYQACTSPDCHIQHLPGTRIMDVAFAPVTFLTVGITVLIGLWILRGMFRAAYGRSTKSAAKAQARRDRRKAERGQVYPLCGGPSRPARREVARGVVLPPPAPLSYVFLDKDGVPIRLPDGRLFQSPTEQALNDDYRQYVKMSEGHTGEDPVKYAAAIDPDGNVVAQLPLCR